jgi:hypothetical protein
MAILGPDVAATGEARKNQLYTNQIAPTVLKMLNMKIDSDKIPAKPIDLKLP